MTVEARSSRVRPDRQELIRLRTLLLTASLTLISQPFQGLAQKKKPGASGANAQESPMDRNGRNNPRGGSHDRRSAKLSN